MTSPEVQSAATDSSVDPEVAAILRSLAPEEVDMLRDAFIYMDRDSDGYVSREEMMSKVSACVRAARFGPLREYLVPLFNVADKDGDGRLSLTEFLTSFADGPGVVPAEVVNNCVAGVRVRLTDEEIFALQESFRAIDRNQDGVLDAEELEAALRDHLLKKFPDLTGENFKEIVAVVMASADADRDGVLSLSEFIRSYQEDQGVLPATFLELSFDRRSAARQLSEEEMTVLREAFAVLDRNDDGFVDVDGLYSALWDTLCSGFEDQDQIRDLCDLVMMTAGRSKRGRLTVSDFVRGFLSNVHLMQIPVAVAQERVRVACDKLQQMHDSGELEKLVLVFEDLDSDGDGYVARSEMVSVLKALFRDAFPGWDDEMLTSVMTAIVVGAETNNGGQLSLEEFIRSFVEGPGALPPVPAESRNASSNILAAASPSALTAPAAPGVPLHERRVSTATDEDLLRITEAVEGLYAQQGRGGAISHEALHTSIARLYTDNPLHGEEMYHYALQQFVQPRRDGTLEWSENVHIEDAEEEEEADATDNADPQNSYGVPRAAISTSSPLEAPSTANGSAPAVSAVADLMRRSGSEVDFAQEGMKTLPVCLLPAEDARGSSVNKVALPPLKAPPAQLEGINNNAYFNDDLRKEFDHYDVDHRGYLDRESFKKTYLQMEQFGLEPSPAELDLRFRRYAHGSDRIHFNEFCILMLQRARM